MGVGVTFIVGVEYQLCALEGIAGHFERYLVSR